MSDTDFRISGSVVDDLTVDEIRESRVQVMHQGIGFNLRPVSNAPLEDSGDFINSETVATGSFMTFLPQGWEAGKFHPKGSVVTDGIWTMVANKLTLEDPYPVPAGNNELALTGWLPTTQSDSSVVYSGHLYTCNESVWVRRINIWVTQITADTSYRVVVVYTTPGQTEPTTTVVENPILTAGAWATIALPNTLLVTGTEVLVYIDGLNSGADNQFTGGWSYTGQDNIGGPVAQSWNQNNARTLVRVSKTDLDGTDRTGELLGVTPDSTLLFADTNNVSAFDQYRVTGAPVDAGTWVEYPSVLQEQGEGGVPLGTTTLTATIPIPQPTEYAEVAGSVPTYTGPDVTAVGFLQFDGVDQGGSANSYGVDLEFETTTVPADWDALAYNAQ